MRKKYTLMLALLLTTLVVFNWMLTPQRGNAESATVFSMYPEREQLSLYLLTYAHSYLAQEVTVEDDMSRWLQELKILNANSWEDFNRGFRKLALDANAINQYRKNLRETLSGTIKELNYNRFSNNQFERERIKKHVESVLTDLGSREFSTLPKVSFTFPLYMPDQYDFKNNALAFSFPESRSEANRSNYCVEWYFIPKDIYKCDVVYKKFLYPLTVEQAEKIFNWYSEDSTDPNLFFTNRWSAYFTFEISAFGPLNFGEFSSQNPTSVGVFVYPTKFVIQGTRETYRKNPNALGTKIKTEEFVLYEKAMSANEIESLKEGRKQVTKRSVEELAHKNTLYKAVILPNEVRPVTQEGDKILSSQYLHKGDIVLIEKNNSVQYEGITLYPVRVIIGENDNEMRGYIPEGAFKIIDGNSSRKEEAQKQTQQKSNTKVSDKQQKTQEVQEDPSSKPYPFMKSQVGNVYYLIPDQSKVNNGVAELTVFCVYDKVNLDKVASMLQKNKVPLDVAKTCRGNLFVYEIMNEGTQYRRLVDVYVSDEEELYRNNKRGQWEKTSSNIVASEAYKAAKKFFDESF